jgi:hypothetical protein
MWDKRFERWQKECVRYIEEKWYASKDGTIEQPYEGRRG